ncbi:OLC1v1028150C1 [Oldenlandia corymbosa var. corymbosa]|uniref:OLC1v1028150C1 n=1 Tax=Oldenlandia corymbosa var. corymbosa TaxID=529605 RepID=A0AAV1CCW6_OLDCO|nr:OLC1v1028150C1 [Oldenlandia corymbosa var. corymbosa]
MSSVDLPENPWSVVDEKKAAKTPSRQPKRLGDPSPKLSRKVSEKFERTKEVASAGMKKVKDGASTGIHWMKLKYNQTKLSKK